MSVLCQRRLRLGHPRHKLCRSYNGHQTSTGTLYQVSWTWALVEAMRITAGELFISNMPTQLIHIQYVVTTDTDKLQTLTTRTPNASCHVSLYAATNHTVQFECYKSIAGYLIRYCPCHLALSEEHIRRGPPFRFSPGLVSDIC